MIHSSMLDGMQAALDWQYTTDEDKNYIRCAYDLWLLSLWLEKKADHANEAKAAKMLAGYTLLAITGETLNVILGIGHNRGDI